MTIVPITVIVLTFNEEKNIKRCLESVKNWATEIIVLDSGSTDATLDIVKFYTTKIYTHPFENYAAQRNWAFANLPIAEDWIMNIDADHELTNEIKAELLSYFNKGFSADIKGFMASRRIMFMNHWVKRGGMYPVYHGVVFKKGFGFCEDKLYDQHFVINGEAILLKGDVLDVITDSLTNFTARSEEHTSELQSL